jgi:hypothetical protein
MFKIIKKIVLLIAGFTLISGFAFSQSDTIPVRDDNAKIKDVEMTHNFDFGLGFGMDYGGLIGIQFGIAPVKHLTFFGAVGYYMFQAGWNAGMKLTFLPKTTKHSVRPFLKAMYGCNSLITAEGTDEYDKVYKGFTCGFGLECRFGKLKQNGLDVELNVPFRTGDFWVDYNKMKNDPSLEVLQGPLPVAFSVGFHHEF